MKLSPPKNRPFLAACLLLLMTLFFAFGCEQGKHGGEKSPQVSQTHKYQGTIVALGDSLTAGHGVREEQAYPALLQKKLLANGYNFKVINAGISGETSSGALSRINWVLKLKPDIIILETGANDGLRGISTKVLQSNLLRIIRILRQNKVIVVLAGMQMVRNLGPDYTSAFAKVYPSVARQEGVNLIPFFLAGVAGQPSLNQEDTIHPTAQGYKIVVDTVYPYVVQAIGRLRSNGKTAE